MEEVEVQDIDFLYGCANPTIIIIHQDTMGRHIKAKELSIKDKEFVKVLHIHASRTYLVYLLIFFIFIITRLLGNKKMLKQKLQ